MSKWGTVKLSDVCEIINGFAFKSNEYSDNGIRVIRISNVQKGEIVDEDPQYIPLSQKHTIGKYLLSEKDLLISLTGNVGRVGLIQRELLPAALNQRVACLRLKNNKLIKLFLYHFLNSNYFERACINESKGIAQKNLSTEWLKEYKIPIPPLETQRYIAQTLDTAAELLTLRKRQLAELDNLIKSTFYDMFGDPVRNEKGWEMNQLKDITKSRLGKMLDTKKQTGLHKRKYLANFNVQWFRFNLDNLNEMDFDDKDRVEFRLESGDLLICEGGEVGRTAIWQNELDECYFQKALHRVRCKQETVIPEYLAYVFFYKAKATGFKEIVGSSTIAHLTGEKIEKILIPLPPLALQNRFATIKMKIEEQKALVQKAIDETQLLSDSLMSEYFE